MASNPDGGTGTLLPTPGALVKRQGAEDTPVFRPFSTEWLNLQGYVAQVQQLPISQGDFTSKYGAFNDASEVAELIGTMRSIRALADTFGDPKKLFDELGTNPTLLNTPEPPAPLYDHIVWTAFQVVHAADTFKETSKAFQDLLNPVNCGTPAQCGNILKEVLVGRGGLQSTAVDIAAKVNRLIASLSDFDSKVAPLNDALHRYTDRSSAILTDAQKAVDDDLAAIASLTDLANAALKKWRDLTISATSVSVGLVVLSGGMLLPVSAVVGGVLGAEAVKARDAYASFCALQGPRSLDHKQKALLVTDLQGLNPVVGSAGDSLTAFIGDLQAVAGAWLGIGNDLGNIVNNYTPEQLGDYSFINQALKCEDATQEWQTIGNAAREFTRNALVPVTVHEFGTPLPNA